MNSTAGTTPRLVVRIRLDEQTVLGPGKADLLEYIDRAGSISAAAREMGMSYRQAWKLVDSLSAAFGRPVIETNQGGRRGGGARLTRIGRRILVGYRTLQAKATKSTRDDLQTIVRLMAPAGKRPAAGR